MVTISNKSKPKVFDPLFSFTNSVEDRFGNEYHTKYLMTMIYQVVRYFKESSQQFLWFAERNTPVILTRYDTLYKIALV